MDIHMCDCVWGGGVSTAVPFGYHFLSYHYSACVPENNPNYHFLGSVYFSLFYSILVSFILQFDYCLEPIKEARPAEEPAASIHSFPELGFAVHATMPGCFYEFWGYHSRQSLFLSHLINLPHNFLLMSLI